MIALPEFESFTLSNDDKSDRSSNWIFFFNNPKGHSK